MEGANLKRKKKDHLTKNLSPPSTLGNLLQMFTESVILNSKKIECRNFFNFKK